MNQDKIKKELEKARENFKHNLIVGLNLLKEFILDEGSVEVRKINYYGRLKFYNDEDYSSFEFNGISVGIKENRILYIEVSQPEKWSCNLGNWLEEMTKEFSEWISQRAEQKYIEKEEANITGN
jgi:hypothetical protein